MAFSLRFRTIHSVGLARLADRGPAVILARHAAFARRGRLPRKADAVYLPHKLRREDVCREHLRSRLEAGELVYLVVPETIPLESVSRMLLTIEAANDYRLGINVYTLAIRFSPVILARRDLWARLQQADDWQTRLRQHREAPQEATLALAHTLEGKLGATGEEIFLEQLARIVTLNLDEQTAIGADIMRQLRARLEARAQMPGGEAAMAHLRHTVRILWWMITALQISDRSLYIHADLAEVRRRCRRSLLGMALLAPLGLWGVFNHYVVYKLPEWVRFWSAAVPSSPWLLRWLAAAPVYALQFLLVERLTSPEIALLYLLSLPLIGYAGMVLVENREYIWDQRRLLRYLNHKHAVKNDLLNMRWEILDTLALDKNQEDYGAIPQTL